MITRHAHDLLGRVVDLPLEECTAIDMGCGVCNTPISKQILTLPLKKLISVDMHIDSLDIMRRIKVNAQEHITYMANFKIVPWLYSNEKPDIAFFIDSLEHLDKFDALSLLGDMERFVTRRILIWLPIGDCPQGEINDNKWQEHKGAWEVKELEDLGYTVDYYPAFHRHFNPPVAAAWAVKDLQNEILTTECS